MLKVKFDKFELKNPVITASGTYGYCDEYDCFTDVSALGAIVTKAITLNPRPGNRNSRIAETRAGMINSIGLENIGIKEFIKTKLPVLKSKNIDFIMNVAGSDTEEYCETAKIAEDEDIKAIELNVSCPNVKTGCMAIGSDETALAETVNAVREVFSGFLLVKLTPNVTCIENLGLAAQKAGADAVTAINTLKGTNIKISKIGGKFNKTILTGGYSGFGIKPVALNAVYRLANCLDIPVIGSGGIETLEDIFEFFAAGAQAVQLGTVNFTHPDRALSLIKELEEYLKTNGFKSVEALKKELRG